MFYSRFNYLMSTMGLKNTDISKGLFIDRSLVSRWRTGKREPNEDIVKQISEIIISLCTDSNSKLLLCRTLQLQYSEALFKDPRILQHTMTQWLLEDTQSDSSFRMSWGGPQIEGVLRPTQINMYSGDNGYRYCVKTLLNTALDLKKEFTLYFFGNDSLDWLVQPPEYFAYLSQLVEQAKEIGIKAKLLIHISNDTRKMENYIKLWSLFQPLPDTQLCGLYGLANREKNRRLFNHISLAIPGVGAVTGWSVKNSPHQYVSYITDPKQTRYVVDDFEILYNGCIPITQKRTDFSYEKMLDLITMDFFADISKEYISHSSALPLGTLPGEILAEMLAAAGADSRTIERILMLHHKFQDWFYTYSAQGVMEYYYLDADESVPRAFPHSDILFGYNLSYTGEQYQAHLENTLLYVQECENFNFYPLGSKPLYPADIDIAYGAYLISFDDPYYNQTTICTHQHFANCVFMCISEAAKQLPEKLFSKDHTLRHYRKKYPSLNI